MTPLVLVGVLDESSLLGKAVDTVVRASLVTEETADGEGGDLTSVGSLVVNGGKVDLNGSVILSSDQAVGSRAGGEDRKNRERMLET